MDLIIKYSDQIYGQMKASIDEMKFNGFIINKSFTIRSILVNDIKCQYKEQLNSNKSYKIVTLEKELNDIETIIIIYSGKLDGTTGLYPYVREKTTQNFALLRYETLCIPYFISSLDDNIHEYILSGFNEKSKITITCDKDLDVFSNLLLKEKLIRNSTIQYTFVGSYLNVVIGPYKTKKFKYGVISGNDKKEMNQISQVITNTIKYMNKKYLKAKLNDLNIILIPANLGSWVVNHTMFLSVTSLSDVKFIIHETIHFGWNPKVDSITQRARFFGEAITQYFTARIYDEYEENGSEKTFNEFKLMFNNIVNKFNLTLYPLVDFAKYEYGDLSYCYGALAIKAIENRIGKENIDRILTKMLKKYKNKEINFQLFFALFNEFNIDDILEDYFYSTKAQNEILSE